MQPIAYCGSPPIPGAVAWNLDPVLIAFLLGGSFTVAALARRRGVPERQQLAFQAGWLLLALLLISPLCNLSVALFSARVGQHMLIEFAAAPLIACGLPYDTLSRPPGLRTALLGAAGFAAVLWFWHLPGPYDWTFRNVTAYWAMHVSLLLAAVLLWKVLLDARQPAASLLASGITTTQMTVLGAIYTFAGRAFFSIHFGTTGPWGLSPLEDQQLGGLLMWIPPGLALAGVTVWTLASLLNTQSRSA